MKHFLTLFSLGRVLPIFGLVLLILGCNSAKTGRNDRLTRSDKLLEQFTQTLRFDQPAACIKMIQDSARNAEEVSRLCVNVMNFARNQPPAIYMQLLGKMDTSFGAKDQALHGTILATSGMAFTHYGQVDTALVLTKEALALGEKIKDSLVIATASQGLSMCYLAKANFPLSLRYIYKALDYIPQKQEIDRVNLYMDLSSIYTNLRDWNKAKEYALKSYSYMEMHKDSATMIPYAVFLSSAFRDLGKGDSALWAAKKAYTVMQARQDTQQVANTYWAMGLAYKLIKDYPNALKYSQLALIASEKSQDLWLKYRINTNIGNCYMAIGEVEKAQALLLNIVKEQISTHKTKVNSGILDSLVVINLIQSNNPFLLNYFRKGRTFIDSLFSTQRMNIIEDLNLSYKTEEKEKRITELAYQKRGLQLQAVGIALIALTILFISAWIIYRNKQKRLLLLKENALLATKKELLENSKESQAKELLANKQQLVDFKANILSKNKLIEQMEQSLQILAQKSEATLTEEYKQNKAALVEKKILTEKDWKIYLNHVEKVHPTLVLRINEKYPNLTQGELRLFILRYLDFDRQEIANILGTSVDSVRKSQSRLRKKIGLDEKLEFNTFLKDFS